MLSLLKKAKAHPKLSCFSYNQSNHIYIYVHKWKSQICIYIYRDTLPPPSMEVANGSLEDELWVLSPERVSLFHFYDCWEKMYILYEIILIIHLLTKDSDIHSHYLSLLFWDLLSRILFPRDSVHGWATETRSNSEYQAPRRIRFLLHMALVCLAKCQCWLATCRGFSTVNEHSWPIKIHHHFFWMGIFHRRDSEFSHAYVSWSRRVYELFWPENLWSYFPVLIQVTKNYRLPTTQ